MVKVKYKGYKFVVEERTCFNGIEDEVVSFFKVYDKDSNCVFEYQVVFPEDWQQLKEELIRQFNFSENEVDRLLDCINKLLDIESQDGCSYCYDGVSCMRCPEVVKFWEVTYPKLLKVLQQQYPEFEIVDE